MNRTNINNHGHLVVEFEKYRPVTIEDREVIAQHVAERLFGIDNVPEGAPRSDYPDKMFWVLDDQNNWFLKFSDTGHEITVWHRHADVSEMITIGALAFELERMILVLLPSQLVH